METIMGDMLAHKDGVGSYVFEGIHKIAGYAPVDVTGWSIGVTQPAVGIPGGCPCHSKYDLAGGRHLSSGNDSGRSFSLRSSITRPIMHAADGLNAGAEQVAAASSQVSRFQPIIG